MKLNIITPTNTVKGNKEMPKQFNEPVRGDLIKRAVLVKQSHDRQPYGADPEAGKRSSAFVSKRRHKYKSTYGIGQSRTPRKVMSYRGTRFNWTGAFAPQTVGGRRAHPPKASKEWSLKINKKERHKAIRSALAATLDKTLVQERGHKIPDNYPFIMDDAFQKLAKTNELKKALEAVKLGDDLKRAEERKVRAGKGTMRGRKYKTKTSVLLVVSEQCPLLKAASNLPGVEAITVNSLNTELLAPGTTPGRLTLFSEAALNTMEKEELFTETTKAKPVEKKTAPKKETPKPAAPKPAAPKTPTPQPVTPAAKPAEKPIVQPEVKA